MIVRWRHSPAMPIAPSSRMKRPVKSPAKVARTSLRGRSRRPAACSARARAARAERRADRARRTSASCAASAARPRSSALHAGVSAGQREERLLERARARREPQHREPAPRRRSRRPARASAPGTTSLSPSRSARVRRRPAARAPARRGPRRRPRSPGRRRRRAPPPACPARAARRLAMTIDVVDGLRDLGEQVAGDEHGAAARRLLAHHAAHPGDAGRVEAVRRLVEQQHLGVAEQRRGDAQALLHAHRVALDAAVGGLGRGRRP